METRLEQQTGITATRVPYKVDQSRVFFRNKQVALYCGAPDVGGRYLSFINTLYEVAVEQGMAYQEVIQQVSKDVTELTKAAPSQIHWPPAPFGPEPNLSELSTQIVVGADLDS